MDGKLIIIGHGAVAAEVLSYLDDINKIGSLNIEVEGFLGSNIEEFEKSKNKYQFTQPFLGAVENWNFNDSFKYIFGFANIEGRLKMIQRLLDLNVQFINIIHPSVQIAKSAKIGFGNIIYPNSIIGPNVQIGNFNLLTSYSFVSHDCRIGDNNFLSTSGLSGNVWVGNNNFFGIRSTVIPSVKIGSNNVIQAGMTVDRDISENETIFYRFKERVSIIREK